MPLRLLIAGYFSVQATAGALWWGMMWLWPASRSWFWPTDTSNSVQLAFATADLVCFVGGSSLAAFMVARHHAWAQAVLWLVTGMVSYAALFVLASLIATGEAPLAAALMVAAAAGTWLATTCYRV